MFKSFLSFIAATFFPSEQLVVVVSDDLNATRATMQRYERGERWEKTGSAVPVTLGRSGLGYAQGPQPLKMEGDGRSPVGLFPITATFGYDPAGVGQMPYLHADEKLICIDDAQDERYNEILPLSGDKPKSFEWMRREDGLYRYGAVIGYNADGKKGRGSCIFLHLNHPDRRPTSGCTAMDEAGLVELLGWLDPEKKPRILQLPRSDCPAYQKEFEGIECE